MTRHSKMQQLINSCLYPEINTNMSSVTSYKLVHLLNTNFHFFKDNCFQNAVFVLNGWNVIFSMDNDIQSLKVVR